MSDVKIMPCSSKQADICPIVEAFEDGKKQIEQLKQEREKYRDKLEEIKSDTDCATLYDEIENLLGEFETALDHKQDIKFCEHGFLKTECDKCIITDHKQGVNNE
jgi:chromosome segregation ATPase